jgi:hypothetical protein
LIDAKINFPSISRWAAPVVLIPKPDGSIRFCVDYRDLNKLTIADPFPLPRVDEILEAVAPSRIFPQNRRLNCFSYHYEFTRIPYCLKNVLPLVFGL